MPVYKAGILYYNIISKFTEQTNCWRLFNMLTTKFIIKKTSYFDGDKYLKGDVCATYFAGYAAESVPRFEYSKKRAKVYDTEAEVLLDLSPLKSTHNPVFFTFSIIPVRCRA
jgi:hypothetical protein